MNDWFVYLLRCADDTLYCGVTTDLERRVLEHNSSAKGAAYTRARRPCDVVWSMRAGDRAEAQSREHQVKSLSRQQKLALIAGNHALPGEQPVAR